MKKNLFFTLTAAMLMYMGGVSAQTWEKTTLSELTTSDIFVIVDLNSATAMTNDNGTSAPSATSVTISDDGTELTSTVADNLKWNVNPSGSYTDNDGSTQTGYTFYPNGSTETWLYATDTNNGVKVGTGTCNAWTEYTDGDYTGLYFVYSSSVTRYLGVYSSSDWRTYTSVNTNIDKTSMAYFKYNASGTAKSQTSLSFEKSSVEVGKSSSAQTVTNTVTLTDADGETIEDASITYSSSSETVTVSDDGTVTIPADSEYGTSATITATYSGDDSYYSSTATYTVTVVYEPGDGVVADELTYEQTGVTSSTYTDFTYTSSATGITYAGSVAGSNNTIQLNNSGSDKGLYSTSLYGKLVAVTAVFNSNTTSSRQLSVYGKSTPYSDASELYDSDSDTQGTQIGSLSNTAGTTTYAVLEVSDKYNYVGIRSYSGAIYLDKVTFYWEKTDDVAATIATSGVSTFSATTNMTIPDDVTAYQAAYSSGTTVTLTKLEGTVIPANTGVVVKGTASSNITFEATSDENSTDDFTNNGLIASSADGCPSSFTDNSEYYALTGGYWYLIDPSVTEVPANKAILYIKGGVTSGAPLDIVFADDTDMDAGSETTGITNATATSAQADGVYYNLQGMRVSNPASGLYIVGGKKVVVR